MVVNYSVWHAGYLPRQRRRARHVHHALSSEQVRLHQRIFGIDEAHFVSDERIAIVVGFKRIGSYSPDARIVFLHGKVVCPAFQLQFNFLSVRAVESESYAIV